MGNIAMVESNFGQVMEKGTLSIHEPDCTTICRRCSLSFKGNMCIAHLRTETKGEKTSNPHPMKALRCIPLSAIHVYIPGPK